MSEQLARNTGLSVRSKTIAALIFLAGVAFCITLPLLRIATFYSPGREARLDHHTVPIRVEKGTNAMVLEGRYTVHLRFGYTPLRRCAPISSLVSLFLPGAIVTVYDAVVPEKRLWDLSGRGG
jgi:hypothetical protein